jgi:hypothetical protein
VHLQNGEFENTATSGYHKHCGWSGTKLFGILFSPYGVGWVPAILLLFTPRLSLGAELDFFRMTRLGGSLELGYSVEDLEVTRVDGVDTHQRRPVSEQKLEIDSQSYVYHPNLLEMILGVGVEYKTEDIETNSGSNKNKQTLYSFNGEFDILKEKPYPVRLYYNQYNPTSSVGLADRVTHENKDYGMLLSLKDPLVSFPVFFRASHSESKGEGGGTTIDSEYDYQDLRILSSGFKNISAHITLDHSRKRSGSGSINLPMQSTVNEKYGINFGSTISFGENKRHTLFNKISYDIDEFKGLTRTEDARFYASLNMEHKDSLKSRYRYNIEKTKNDDLETESKNENITIGLLSDISENLSFTGDLEATDEETQGFNKNTIGVRSFFRYKSELSELLSINSSYLYKYKLSEQVSDVNQLAVTGEMHLLDNLHSIVLNNVFVAPGSVVVSNRDRTQTYIEGLDYLLTVVGAETRLERLLSGNISDGETVLVDYSYETGGTFTYGLTNQALTAGFTLYKNYRFSVGYSKQEESLEEGLPIRPLYTTETAYASTDARHRLTRTIGLSWRLAVERERGELRPFIRKEADINLSTALPILNGFANLHSRYENVDNELSDEDVNLTLHGVSLFVRTGFRSRASLKYSVEKDTGGTIPRKVKRAEVDYMWRWRLLSFRLKGEYDLEEQGGASRQDSSVYLTLIRDF